MTLTRIRGPDESLAGLWAASRGATHAQDHDAHAMRAIIIARMETFVRNPCNEAVQVVLHMGFPGGATLANIEKAASHQSVFLPAPDLIDFFIILLLSVAVDIAILWLGTQFVGSVAFAQLPHFVSDVFSSIWSTVITGTAGIGLAILKTVVNREASRPNYPLYVLLTAGFILVAASIAAYAASGRPSGPIVVPPPGVDTIDPDKTKGVTDFDLEPPGNVPSQIVTYKLRGTYTLKDGHITGELSPSTLQTFDMKFPMRITRVSIQLCYIHKIAGGPFNGQEGMEFHPAIPRARNAADVNLNLEANKSYPLPGLKFNFDLPDDYTPKKGWLCGAIYNDSGYFPAL